MKKLLLFVLLALFAAPSLYAQDTIVMRDASEISARVTQISLDEVVYKNWGNLDGPSYTIPREDVFYIKYADGRKEVFNTVYSSRSNIPRSKKSNSIAFSGIVNGGALFRSNAGGPIVDITLGACFADYFYIGFKTGFYSLIWRDELYHDYYDIDFQGYCPLGINMKGYFTKDTMVRPYFTFSLSSMFGFTDVVDEFFYGLSTEVGLGLDINRFNICVGYNCSVDHCGFIKLGYRFGR